MQRVSLIGFGALRLLFLVFDCSLALMVRGFVVGVIHSDRAVRKSEGGGSDYSRVSWSAPGIQKSMGVAGYVHSTEEFGDSGLLLFVMIGRFEEQRMGKRRVHVKMQSEYGKRAIEWR